MVDMGDVARLNHHDDQHAITNSAAGLTLVVGDSGIGKSTLLSSLDSWPGDPLVSKPIVLKAVQGSLQTAVADAISDCITQFLDGDDGSGKTWTIVKSLAERAGTVTGREIGRLVAGRALEFAEAKLGKEAVELGRKILGDTLKGGVLGFDDQLAAIRVPDRAADLAQIMAEVSEATGRALVLLLDNAERLAPPDHGLLAELVTSVRGTAHVVVCVTPHQIEGDEVIRLASARGALAVTMQPLTPPVIEAWLRNEDVPPSQWDSIVRVSSGYPFFIADAIRATNAGTSLDTISAPDGFEALMRASWSRIAPNLQLIVAKLAPFADPPNDDFLTAYLNLNAVEWGLVRSSLEEAGIFVRLSDGASWFHDRRRIYVWEKALSDSLRSGIAEACLAAVSSWIDKSKSIEFWVPATAAVLGRSIETPSHGELSNIRLLSDGSIALLWGLIEVMEHHSTFPGYAEIGQVVRHAESRSRMQILGLVALEDLIERGLIEVREENDTSFARINLTSAVSFAAVLGEILLRFHATPRPQFASTAFDRMLRPLMGPFEGAIVSLGRTSYASHKEEAALLTDPQRFTRIQDAPTLGGTVLIDDQPVSFTARFESEEHRELTAAGLRKIAVGSPRLQLVRTVPFPRKRLRYGRYRSAIEALGVEVDDIEVSSAADIARQLELHCAHAEVFAEASSLEEVEALGLQPSRYLLEGSSAPGSWTSIKVRSTRRVPTPLVGQDLLRPRDPLLEPRLRAEGLLKRDEQVLQTVYHYRSRNEIKHPLAELLDAIDQRGKKYNSGFRSVLIPPAADLLQAEIANEQERTWELAAAMVNAGLVDERPRRRTLLINYHLDTDSQFYSDFGNWIATVLEVDDDNPTVIVQQTQGGLTSAAWPDMIVPPEFGPYAGAKASRWQSGDAGHIIAGLLGYGTEDAHMTDLNNGIGPLLRQTYDVLGE